MTGCARTRASRRSCGEWRVHRAEQRLELDRRRAAGRVPDRSGDRPRSVLTLLHALDAQAISGA